ncbi:MAG: MoxR family ATPase, partial [Leptolyngbya sp. SIO4C1]|nr:MoxR family ATPase [Leptolyngbya sp. SIO4C1]
MVEALDLQSFPSNIYTGETQPQPDERFQGQPIYPYVPSSELVDAVNLAIYLKRPLLLKGEPGCGKTELARAVAYELALEFIPFPVKSTSRARDLLYTYDSVARLRDAQLANSGEVVRRNAFDYVNFGPLGKAFYENRKAVVLIDEIDKADIDFPNDLLWELERSEFEIVELPDNHEHRKVSADETARPIIFITSN